MNECVIGVGSNIQAEINIIKGKQMLGKIVSIVKESQFIKTKPLGEIHQDHFTNGSILIQTVLSYEELLDALKGIEVQLGREKTKTKNAPRQLDLDIIVWNKQVVHSDFYERDFLRNSVLELIPELVY